MIREIRAGTISVFGDGQSWLWVGRVDIRFTHLDYTKRSSHDALECLRLSTGDVARGTV